MTTSPETIRVTVSEYATGVCACPLPSAADRAAAEALAAAGGDAKLRIRWLVGDRVEISSTSWVGVVRFSNLEIRIVPKLVGDELNVLRMIAYSSGVDVIRRLANLRALPPSGEDFLQLVCLFLAEEAGWVVRRGILRTTGSPRSPSACSAVDS